MNHEEIMLRENISMLQDDILYNLTNITFFEMMKFRNGGLIIGCQGLGMTVVREVGVCIKGQREVAPWGWNCSMS